ncbi:GGDEF domain-containing protein [Oceanithermus sp.]
MHALVNTDSSTSALSRKRLLEEAEEAPRGLRPGRALSFAPFDLGDFKKINDRYGHPTGDVVLVRCAKRARHGLRDGDRLGPLGGEEFGVLLSDTELSATRRLDERLRVSLEAPADEGPDVTASFGVVQARPGRTLSRLLTEADRALYQAKRSGKNRVVTREDGPDAARDPVQKV